jgi:hypothetical protein
MEKEICTNCGSDDIISPRRCDLNGNLTTYCPKCDDTVVSNEYYICHASEEHQHDFSVYICPGCKSHLHSVPTTKEESIAQSKIAKEIIDEIFRKEGYTLDPSTGNYYL